MGHARAVMHGANPRWCGKRSWHSQRMRSSQFYVSDKRPMAGFVWYQELYMQIMSQRKTYLHTCNNWSCQSELRRISHSYGGAPRTRKYIYRNKEFSDVHRGHVKKCIILYCLLEVQSVSEPKGLRATRLLTFSPISLNFGIWSVALSRF